jgi:hypothetical protein
MVSFAGEAEPNQSLGEVVVQGSRIELAKMRAQMVVLEQRFFERYNALNPIDDFDVYCNMELRTGTRVKRQSCRSVYENRAFEREGREYLQFLQSNAITSGGPVIGLTAEPPMMIGAPPAQTAEFEIGARRKEYQQNMIKVTRADPQLIELLRERSELIQRYNTLQKAKFRRN